MDTPKGPKGKGGIKRGESIKDRSAYNIMHKVSIIKNVPSKLKC